MMSKKSTTNVINIEFEDSDVDEKLADDVESVAAKCEMSCKPADSISLPVVQNQKNQSFPLNFNIDSIVKAAVDSALARISNVQLCGATGNQNLIRPVAMLASSQNNVMSDIDSRLAKIQTSVTKKFEALIQMETSDFDEEERLLVQKSIDEDKRRLSAVQFELECSISELSKTLEKKISIMNLFSVDENSKDLIQIMSAKIDVMRTDLSQKSKKLAELVKFIDVISK